MSIIQKYKTCMKKGIIAPSAACSYCIVQIRILIKRTITIVPEMSRKLSVNIRLFLRTQLTKLIYHLEKSEEKKLHPSTSRARNCFQESLFVFGKDISSSYIYFLRKQHEI